jgi:hypothetical protein
VKKVPARFTLIVLLLAAPALHAQEFYSEMLQRGVSDALRGSWAKAANELRIASFGAINDLQQYQTAQVYLTVANERLGRTEDARAAAVKAVQAERLSPAYAGASIDPSIRQAFDQLLPKLLTAERYAGLPAFSKGRATVAQAVAPPMPMPQVAAPAPAPPPVPVPVPAASITPPPTPAPKFVPPPAAAPAIAKPVQQRPAPQPPAPQPPPQPQPQPAVTQRVAAQVPPPQPVVPQPATIQSPLAAAARRSPSQSSFFADFAPRVAEAQRLLNEGKMLAARQAFLGIARTTDAPRSALLDAAKGLSQTNAWNDSSVLYSKLFPLQKGEESHYFYEAVNRFELGEVATARDLLHRALPFVGNSREVAIYRGRIEGTVQ